jgi:hypothetical protein
MHAQGSATALQRSIVGDLAPGHVLVQEHTAVQ